MRTKRILIFVLFATVLSAAAFYGHRALRPPAWETLAVNAITSSLFAFALVAVWRLSAPLSRVRVPWHHLLQFLSWRRWIAVLAVLICAMPLLWISGSWLALRHPLSEPTFRKVVAAALVLTFAFSWWLAGKLLFRRITFSIRELLLAISLLALFFATIGRDYLAAQAEQRRQHLIQEIEDRGGFVLLREKETSGSSLTVFVETDDALKALITHPDRGFIDGINLAHEVTLNAKTAARLNEFPSLNALLLRGGAVQDETLRKLRAWKPGKGHSLTLVNCERLTDEGFRHLAERRDLRSLAISNEWQRQMEFTKDQVRQIANCRQLRHLFIIGAAGLDDNDVGRLATMKQLERLQLYKTKITPVGLKRLYDALPDCRIDTDIAGRGSRNVRRVQVRRPPTDAGGGTVEVITDKTRIKELLNWSDSVRSGNLDVTEVRPAGTFTELVFYGKSRPLYHVLVSESEHHRIDPLPGFADDRWYSHSLGTEQREKLAAILKH